jgi:hypothetical protein
VKHWADTKMIFEPYTVLLTWSAFLIWAGQRWCPYNLPQHILAS